MNSEKLEEKIRVLVVDDSNFMRKLLQEMLSSYGDIEVIGEASDGKEAIEKINTLKPDVVTMDIVMPGQDGLSVLSEIMKINPVPVILISSIADVDSEIIEEVYSLGVVDIVSKPDNLLQIKKVSSELAYKIRSASKIDKERLLSFVMSPQVYCIPKAIMIKAYKVLVIGVSAGGTTSLVEVLTRLPENFIGGIIVAQHMPPAMLEVYIEKIKKLVPFKVKVARKGDIVRQKTVLFSPGDKTISLLKTKKGVIVDLTTTGKRLQPDIDAVFKSCAETFKDQTVAVVLSGISIDALEGSKEVKKFGGKIIAENEETAGVYGMPKSVFDAGLADYSVPSYKIADIVTGLVNGVVSISVKNDECAVKGVILKISFDFLQKKLGKVLFDKKIKLFDEEERKVFEYVVANKFYPSDIYISILKKIYENASLVKEEIDTLFENMGINEFEEVSKIYKISFLDKILTIEDYVPVLPQFIKVLFQRLEVEAFSLDVRQGIGFLKLSGMFLKDEFFAEIEKNIFSGWIKQALFKFGIKNVLIRSEKIQKNNEIEILFYIKW